MGCKRKGHLHRPALSLAARIRDHRHLTRTTRGCASQGTQGSPPRPPRVAVHTQAALSTWSGRASAPTGLRTPTCSNEEPSTANQHHFSCKPQRPPDRSSSQPAPLCLITAHRQHQHSPCKPPKAGQRSLPTTLPLPPNTAAPGEGQENWVPCCSPLSEPGEAQVHPAQSLSCRLASPHRPWEDGDAQVQEHSPRHRPDAQEHLSRAPRVLQKRASLLHSEGRDLSTQLLQSLLPTLQDHELPLLHQSEQDCL